MSEFSKKLLNIMTYRKLSQAKIAEMAGVSQTIVWRWLNQDLQPRMSHIEKLASNLNLRITDLVETKENLLTEEDKQFLALPLDTKKSLLKLLDFINDNPKLLINKTN